MVNLILKYIEPQLKSYLAFVNRVDSPVFRISTGEMIKGNGQEKETVSINDQSGNSIYVRQTQPETYIENKRISSCEKTYTVNSRCRLLFYSFESSRVLDPEKVKSVLQNCINKLDFSEYTGTANEITTSILSSSSDVEKLYTEETGKIFEGGQWPVIVAVDFSLNFKDENCEQCDVEDIYC